MFDPWTASFEETKAEMERWLASGNPVSSPLNPFFQAVGANRVMALKEMIDGSNGFAVLHAIRICVTNGLVAPEWLAHAFNRRFDAVVDYRAVSWDDPLAFGKPYKSVQMAAEKKRRHRRFEVWNAIVDKLEKQPDAGLWKEFFGKLGTELRPPIGGTLANEYYAEVKKLLGISNIKKEGSLTLSINSASKRKPAGLRKKIT